MKCRVYGLLALVATAFVGACSDGSASSAAAASSISGVPDPEVRSVIITSAPNGPILLGSCNQNPSYSVHATVYGVNNPSQDVTFRSSNPSVAQVNNLGSLTVVAAGMTVITATSNFDPSKVSPPDTITVALCSGTGGNNPPTVTINPPTASGFVTTTQDLIAVVANANSAGVWQSMNPSIIAVTITNGTASRITYVSPGTAQVCYILTAGSVQGCGTYTALQQQGLGVVSVQVNPPGPIQNCSNTSPSVTFTYGVTVVAQTGVSQAVRWSTSTPDLGSIDQTSGKVTLVPGKVGTFVGVAASVVDPTVTGVGNVQITTTGCSTGTTVVTVSPQNQTLTLSGGSGCSVSQQFSASVNGSLVAATWTASGGSITSSGLFTGTVAGTYIVTATFNGSSGSSTGVITGSCGSSGGLTSLAISPPSGVLLVGQTLPLTAIPTPAGAVTSVSWSITSATPGCAILLGGADLMHNVVKGQLAGCSVVVTITGPGGITATGIYTVIAGTVTCSVAPADGTSFHKGVPTSGSASCTSPTGKVYRPFWSSSVPTTLSVNGSDGVIPIGGVNFPVGTTATFNPLNLGDVTVTVQPEITDGAPADKVTMHYHVIP